MFYNWNNINILKIALDGFSSTMKMREVSELEDISIETTLSEEQIVKWL